MVNAGQTKDLITLTQLESILKSSKLDNKYRLCDTVKTGKIK